MFFVKLKSGSSAVDVRTPNCKSGGGGVESPLLPF